jgi:nucleoside-diphosphate-sugar epimerase
MRVLVTGGLGRLGVTVCETFVRDGFQVRAFDVDTERNRKAARRLSDEVEVMWGDVTQADSVRTALEGADAVVHMAGILPPVAYENPELARRVNVGGTGTIVEALKGQDGRIPFVFTSSVAVFGPTPDAGEPISPDRNGPSPSGTYGETKLGAENLIKESGIDYAILRLTAVMYFTHEVSDLKRMFSVPLNNRVEFCHPDDLAVAVVNAVKSFDKVKGNTMVVSGGPAQRMLYRDMVGALLGVMGLPLPPARKFTRQPYYLDWYDTGSSQALLGYQRRTFADYLRDYSRGLAGRYTAMFLPFMRYFVGPVFGKAVVQFM